MVLNLTIHSREIWTTDDFDENRPIWNSKTLEFKMKFAGYSEPTEPMETTLESGSFVGYRTKHREWNDNEDRLVAIKKHNSVRSDGWDPETGDTYTWMTTDIFYW